MEFLLPHVEGRSTVTNLGDINDNDSTQDSELQFSEDSALSPPSVIRSPTPGTSSASASVARASTSNSTPFTSRRTNKNDSDNLLQEMVGVMKTTQEMRQKRAVPDMDDNDLFFLSMSKQLKKLPKIDQADIKFQLHKLIHDSEIKMINNSERTLNTPIKVPLIIKRNEPLIIKQNEPLIIKRSQNLNTNKILSNPILAQFRAEQSQNETLYLKEFYDNFGHDVGRGPNE